MEWERGRMITIFAVFSSCHCSTDKKLFDDFEAIEFSLQWRFVQFYLKKHQNKVKWKNRAPHKIARLNERRLWVTLHIWRIFIEWKVNKSDIKTNLCLAATFFRAFHALLCNSFGEPLCDAQNNCRKIGMLRMRQLLAKT